MRKRRNHIPIQMTSDFFNSLLERLLVAHGYVGVEIVQSSIPLRP
jgi:hypothetical protein